MVDYVKRAVGTGDIHPDEEILAACNFTASPFSVQNAGMTGGLIAGGVAGMAIGAAWDRYLARRNDEDAAAQELPEVVTREAFAHELPANGSLVAVTTKRVVVWKISGLGTPRHQLFEIPFGDIDQVVWDEAEFKVLRGKPASTLVWMGVGDTVLPMSAISGGPNRKHVQAVLGALEARLPGRVSRFEA